MCHFYHFLKTVWATSFILYEWGVMCSPLSHNYMVQLRSAQVSDSEENGCGIDQWESSKSDFGTITGYEIPSSQNSISGYSQTTWNAQCCSYSWKITHIFSCCSDLRNLQAVYNVGWLFYSLSLSKINYLKYSLFIMNLITHFNVLLIWMVSQIFY